ncbi:hypothetical protein AB3479_36980, partial [Rhizobium mongolense]
MSDLVNFIQIDDETNTLTGNLATLTFDIDITGAAVESTNPKAPVRSSLAVLPLRYKRIRIARRHVRVVAAIVRGSRCRPRHRRPRA